MKLVVAEKPSVAKYIAEYLGANSRLDGYFEGNGYQVSWAVGHLLSLGQAKDYGYNKWSDIPLPFFPDFRLIPVNDTGLKALLNINKKLMNKAELIINATDAEREGELIFRYLYEYSGSNVAVKRLWISALTKESIDNGFRNLKNSGNYDNLYYSAKARNHADWIVGNNATTKISLRSGDLFTIGRVQTPVLKLIVDRTLQNKNFKKTIYLNLILELEEGRFKAFNDTDYENTPDTEEKLERINIGLDNQCIVKEATISTSKEKPPKLYSLSALQMDSNKKFGFKASRTLEIAQELYQEKLISYPRTDSQFLSADMFNLVSDLFNRFKSMRKDINFDSSKVSLDNKSVFNDAKVSDHHAILPTNEPITSMDADKKKVYGLILMRFLASFAPDALKRNAKYILSNKEYDYKLTCNKYEELGWKLLYGNAENYKSDFIIYNKGEALTCKPSFISRETKPKPLYTDASLILAMNSAGKELESEEQLEAMKGKGLGTPATQSGIIERLIKSLYIERKGKSLLATNKGVEIITVLDKQDSSITSVTLTAAWEQKISMIQKGELSFDDFMKGIFHYTKVLMEDMENIEITQRARENKNEILGKCPKCCDGEIRLGKKSYFCSNFSNKDKACNFHIFKKIANKTITAQVVKQLITKKATKKLKFKNKSNVPFEAKIILKDDYSASLKF